mgnify:CR=1 FL=1
MGSESGSRAAEAGELCPCGRPAKIVHVPSGEYATLTEVVGGKPAGIADCLVRIDPLKLWPNRAAPSGDGAGEW